MRIKNFCMISISLVLSCSFTSCDKEETKKETIETDEGPRELRYVKSVVLGNQFDSHNSHGFDVKKMKIDEEKDDTIYFGFAYYETEKCQITDLPNGWQSKWVKLIDGESSFDFINATESELPKYMIGSPHSKDIQLAYDVSVSSFKDITFYDFDENVNSQAFDNLKTEEDLIQLLDKARIHRNTKDKSCNIIFSNGYSWGNSIFGFETEEGIKGMIKILSNPYKYSNFDAGQIEIAVKAQSYSNQ